MHSMLRCLVGQGRVRGAPRKGKRSTQKYASVVAAQPEVAGATQALPESCRAAETAADAAQIQATAGSMIAVIPLVIATYEFSKRIVMQRRCARCGGSGLILDFYGREAKCDACGGFLPWKNWRLFFSLRPGNGGPLRQPRGQGKVLYDVNTTIEQGRKLQSEEKNNDVAGDD